MALSLTWVVVEQNLPGGRMRLISKHATQEEAELERDRPMVSVKLHDKLSALKALGQHLGLFKKGNSLNGGKPIPVILGL